MKNRRWVLVAALVLLSAWSARAQVGVEVRLRVAPPPVRVEVVTSPPGPDAYWIAGHWMWGGGPHVWVAGHWERSRVGEVYVRAHWIHEGDEWVFHPGHWAKIVAPPEFTAVAVRQAPPPLQVEVIPPQPSVEHFWIPGYWRWEHNRHVWVSGRWELHRAGYVWAQAHWVRVGAEWRFAGGHWQRY
jgi:hypothetical protein